MSMHKIPLTPIEEAGLRAHGLDIGTPSQLSDAFRQGVRFARDQLPTQGGEAVARVSVWNIDPWYATDPSMAWRNIGVKFLGDHAKTLVDGQSLYTHPADQVEDDLTMVKVSRELLERAVYNMELAEMDGPTCRELRAILAKP